MPNTPDRWTSGNLRKLSEAGGDEIEGAGGDAVDHYARAFYERVFLATFLEDEVKSSRTSFPRSWRSATRETSSAHDRGDHKGIERTTGISRRSGCSFNPTARARCARPKRSPRLTRITSGRSPLARALRPVGFCPPTLTSGCPRGCEQVPRPGYVAFGRPRPAVGIRGIAAEAVLVQPDEPRVAARCRAVPGRCPERPGAGVADGPL